MDNPIGKASDHGIRVTVTDTNDFPEYSFIQKLKIFLAAPFKVCRCGTGKHLEWPKSPAEIYREAMVKGSQAFAAAKDKQILAMLKEDNESC